MSDHILEARGLQVRYEGRLVLDVPEIGVRRAETLAIIGPNGAGKSTLLRVLGLLELPNAGQICLQGNPTESDLLAARRRFASVFQEPLLLDATVERNVGLGLELRRTSRRQIKERAARWMRRLGIAHLASRHARTLSGGEAQRVSLARAFALEPDILLLDEPFAALDPQTRDGLLRELQQALRESPVTTIFVTHDREEALRLGDRIAVVMDGRLQQIAAPEEAFGRPISEHVARFVGVENLLTGCVGAEHDGLLTIDTGSALVRAPGRLPVGTSVLVCLRPEDLALRPALGAEPHDSVLNHLGGRVTDLVLIGSQYRVELECGHPMVALVTKHSVQALGLVPSSEVVVSFKASAAHVIVRQHATARHQ